MVGINSPAHVHAKDKSGWPDAITWEKERGGGIPLDSENRGFCLTLLLRLDCIRPGGPHNGAKGRF